MLFDIGEVHLCCNYMSKDFSMRLTFPNHLFSIDNKSEKLSLFNKNQLGRYILNNKSEFPSTYLTTTCEFFFATITSVPICLYIKYFNE